MYLHNNLKFDIGAQHTVGDTQYPRGWFLDPDNCAKAGITEVPDPVWPDPELFTASENPDGTLTITPLDPEVIADRAAAKLASFQAGIVYQTQERLDAFARTRNYDSILSACTYATDPNPKFSDEGQYCVSARSSTWAALYAIMKDVQNGVTIAPTSYTDIESLLPPLLWPL